MNLKEVTRNELKHTVDHLLLGSPTVDISNLDCRISGAYAMDYYSIFNGLFTSTPKF